MTRKPGDAVKMQENPDLATERLGEKTKPKERNTITTKAIRAVSRRGRGVRRERLNF